MKKIIAILLAFVMVLSLTACGKKSSSKITGEAAIFWYSFEDTYLTSVREAMHQALDDAKVSYQDYDAQGSKTTQTEQIQQAITKGASVLIVNVADIGSKDSAQSIVNMAKGVGIPVVFFNRPVAREVVTAYSRAAYVGTDYTMVGHLQGKMIGRYVLANYDALDLNHDGLISYVLLKGQENNAEADARTQYSVENANAILAEADKPALKFYDESNGNQYLVDQGIGWSAQQGREHMRSVLSVYNESARNMVELVIANNDDMALGAISALQSAGYNLGDGGTTIPVFGVDATAGAQSAIDSHFMTGTIKQDATAMAKTVVKIAANLCTALEQESDKKAKTIVDKFDGIDPNWIPAEQPEEEAQTLDTEGSQVQWCVNIPYSVYGGA